MQTQFFVFLLMGTFFSFFPKEKDDITIEANAKIINSRISIKIKILNFSNDIIFIQKSAWEVLKTDDSIIPAFPFHGYFVNSIMLFPSTFNSIKFGRLEKRNSPKNVKLPVFCPIYSQDSLLLNITIERVNIERNINKLYLMFPYIQDSIDVNWYLKGNENIDGFVKDSSNINLKYEKCKTFDCIQNKAYSEIKCTDEDNQTIYRLVKQSLECYCNIKD